MNEQLLKDVRNYLDITWEDEAGDEKLSGLIARGIAYLDQIAGTELEYEKEEFPRALLFDYVRYGDAGALDVFSQNFLTEINTLRIHEVVSTSDS